MNRDDIVRMAREAGLPAFLYPELIVETDWKLIERFAALVASAEREECAAMFADEDYLFEGRHIAAAIRARGNQ